MPIQYAGILAEHKTTRQKCSLFDVSHMGEFLLEGPTAEADLEQLLTLNVARIPFQACRYGFLLRDDGGVLDDLTCYRLDKTRFMLVVNAGTCQGDAEWIRAHLSDTTSFTDLSRQTGKIDIQGPASRSLAEAALNTTFPDLKFFSSCEQDLLGIPCRISRSGYTGEWGYELYIPWDKTALIWDALIEAGLPPAGLGARDTLRMEMGYALYGHELSENESPVAVSSGAFIDLNKSFIGRRTVEQELKNGQSTKLVGLILQGRRAARAGDIVQHKGRTIGRCTSGCFAPSLNCAAALAIMESAHATPGTEVEIAIRGKTLTAQVAALPLWKQGSARKK